MALKNVDFSKMSWRELQLNERHLTTSIYLFIVHFVNEIYYPLYHYYQV